MSTLLIVGYDPGTTAGLAIIDTKGDIVFLKSKRGFKKSEIITMITERGKALIIASDRYPLPKSVKKLASTLGCKYYRPSKPLSSIEKSELVIDFTERLSNDHESDALASALKAFKVYSKIFKKTESMLSSVGLGEFYERVVESVVLGKVENLNEAINKILIELRKSKKPVVIKKVVEIGPKDKIITKLQQKIKRLEKDVEILKKYNEGLKKKLRTRESYYKKRIARGVDLGSPITIQKNINKLKESLIKKESMIERLKAFRKMELEGYIPILELDEPRKAKDLHETTGLEDRVVLVNKLINAQILNDYKIKALIAPHEPDEKILERVNFPIIVQKDISIEKIKNILAIKKQEFEVKVKEARKVGFAKWLKGHKERKL